MSEKLHNNGPEFKAPEKQAEHQESQHRKHEAHKSSEHTAEEYSREKVEAIHKAAKAESRSAREVKIEEKEEPKHEPKLVSKQLKSMTYKRTLKHIQHKLSFSGKTFSKVIHQPAVNAVSEAGEKTIGRPAGLLGGGLIALIGSVVLLYMSKHWGFKYNLLIFAMLFAAGYIFGVALEFITRAFSKKNR